ncbi:DUF6377 domain-containing protein [Lentimicrobium sp. S6]|uniref:DUF6377 domain-containing protein n=1 Tax=Lentimicrobium sp. S6 TaxID=2735872 RepID=UPI001555B63B|nr:DUF6377 domain-containing protein [Lentimicrobium sp. S6]NPD45878.1 transcriptional regulator [Lentimicrobium sp. S6]
MRVFCPFFILLMYSSFAFANQELDSLIGVLEKTMDQRAEFDAQKDNRLIELKRLFNKKGISKEQQFFINNQLIDNYLKYTLDSAISYLQFNIQLAQELQNKELLNQTNIMMADIMATTGKYFDAMDFLSEIDSNAIQKNLRISYYKALIKIYNEVSFYSPFTDSNQKYSNQAKAYTNRLLPYLNPQSDDYLSILEKKYRDERDLSKCLKINNQRLSKMEIGSSEFSLITYERSLLYQLEKNEEERMKYLCLSAISDIRASIKDNASLTELALVLYKKGDIDKANLFIKFSFEDAAFFNSELRFKNISEVLPIINDAYQMKIEGQQSKLRILLMISSGLLVLLLIAFYFIVKQTVNDKVKKKELSIINKQLNVLNQNLADANKKLNNTNSELSESNHLKEHYIGNFLSICSDYIYKLDQLNKRVNKQLANRKIEELFAETKSKKLIDAEVKEFYINFDKAFLHIFPNFLVDFNKLLIDEEQIQIKSEERLNTELRIFALIRLGIKDSSKIAKLLRYSVNTIYNYRVKIKNNGKGERENFENEVMKIDAVKN